MIKKIHVFKSIDDEIRKDSTYNERWETFEKGLITSWESGRKNRETIFKNEAEYLKNGALPKLSFTGGHVMSDDGEYKKNYVYRYGTFNYLAQRQGILGLDLDINTDRDEGLMLTCSDTGLKTIFTIDQDKYKENKTYNKRLKNESL